MLQSDFYDYASLLKTGLQTTKKDETGENFYWRDIRELKVTKDEPKVLNFKTKIDGEYRKLSFKKRGRNLFLSPLVQYNSLVPISIKKKKN